MSPRNGLATILTVLMILKGAVLTGCAGASVDSSEKAEVLVGRPEQGQGQGVSRATLQDALLRFASSVSANLNQAFSGLRKSPDPKIRTAALKNLLNYDSSALDIALGSVPEASLLDMVAFLELSRNAFANHWMPHVYGSAGAPVLNELDRASKDSWKFASLILTPTQTQKLQNVIRKWEAKHPNQYAVEGVRLTQFAWEAGAQAREEQEEIGGLLSSVQQATQKADQAVLLGERSLYYAQRAPFLMRMQAQASIGELINAAATATSELHTENVSGELQGLAATGDLLLRDGLILTKEARAVLELIFRNPEFAKLGKGTIDGVARILEEYNRALSSPIHAQSMAGISGITQRFESSADRVLVKMIAAAMLLIAFTGGVILAARIAYRRWLDAREVRRVERDDVSSGKKAA